jgi:hypothetical protein
MDLVLTPAELGKFQEALLSAFNRSELEQLIYFKLAVNLNDVVADGPYRQVVTDLIKWANGQGKIESLLRAAREENPGNVLLRQFDDAIRVRSAPPQPTPPRATKIPRIQLRELVDLLQQVPGAADFAQRSAFLAGIPGTQALTRSQSSLRADLDSMVNGLNELGCLASGEWPLLILIDNALGYVRGFELELQMQAVHRQLAQAYGEA